MKIIISLFILLIISPLYKADPLIELEDRVKDLLCYTPKINVGEGIIFPNDYSAQNPIRPHIDYRRDKLSFVFVEISTEVFCAVATMSSSSRENSFILNAMSEMEKELENLINFSDTIYKNSGIMNSDDYYKNNVPKLAEFIFLMCLQTYAPNTAKCENRDFIYGYLQIGQGIIQEKETR